MRNIVHHSARNAWIGLTAPFSALRLIISRPRLMAQSMIPIVITFAVYYWTIEWAYNHLETWIQNLFQNWGMHSNSWGPYLLSGFIHIILYVFGALTFSFTASLAALPFNDLLAQETEKHIQPLLSPTPAVSTREFFRLIGIDFIKTLFALFFGICVLLFSWLPLLNAVSLFLAFLLIAFQYISYPQTRRGIGTLGGLLFIWRNLTLCLGFGASVMFLFSIPFLSAFALPLAVVGGTQIFAIGIAPEKRS